MPVPTLTPFSLVWERERYVGLPYAGLQQHGIPGMYDQRNQPSPPPKPQPTRDPREQNQAGIFGIRNFGHCAAQQIGHGFTVKNCDLSHFLNTSKPVKVEEKKIYLRSYTYKISQSTISIWIPHGKIPKRVVPEV
jgi:hypothetical protein